MGIYNLDSNPVNTANLDKMLEILAHRGADRTGQWHEGAIGLGHRMLWHTPESLQEKLPLVSRNSNYVITADARIDNREELISALLLNRYLQETISDSEIILAAYKKWGKQCSEKLLGDFAFAIWDKSQQSIFCARDHFGVKPFYYYYLPKKAFIFASEIKGILCLPEVSSQLNETRVGDYLEAMFEDRSITFYQNIYRLAPSHCLTVSSHKFRLEKYYVLDAKYELHLSSEREYIAAFDDIFTRAVSCRLRGAFPVGSFLSGGLDSSSITSVASQILARQNTPLKTFSAIFDKITQCDERVYINEILACNSVIPSYVRADQLSPLGDIDRVLWHQDEPFYAPNLFIHWSLYKSAKQQGVRIILDGFLGDTTVSHGWPYLIELARKFRWITLLKEIQSATKRNGGSTQEWLKHYLWQYSLKPWVSENLRQAWRKLKGYQIESPKLDPIVNSDFARNIKLLDRIQAFSQNRSQIFWTAREYHHQDIISGANSFALEGINKAASAFGIEARFPFTDKRLVEFCLAIPPQEKFHNGWIRYLMRRALAKYLPPKVQWRTDKGNLYPNFHHGLSTLDRQCIEGVLITKSSSIERFIDTKVLNRAYQNFNDCGLEDDAALLWIATTLGLWLCKEEF
nr:lasso peptide isopeptide bond-forming cyclase [Myxosarcina sp. GI1]